MRARAFGNMMLSARGTVNHRSPHRTSTGRSETVQTAARVLPLIAAAAAVMLQQAPVPVFLGNSEGPENIAASP